MTFQNKCKACGDKFSSRHPKEICALCRNEQGDAVCKESDGCPTEKAVLQRFWRAHQHLKDIGIDPDQPKSTGPAEEPSTNDAYLKAFDDGWKKATEFYSLSAALRRAAGESSVADAAGASKLDQFEYACSLLPSDTFWGEHLTPAMVLHIASAAIAKEPK